MGKLIGGSSVKILWGASDLTSFFSDMSIDRSNDLQDTTRFGDAQHKYGKGIDDGDVVLTGLYDDVAANLDGILNTAFGAAAGTVATLGPAALTIGNAVRLLSAREAQYRIENGSTGTYQKLAATIKADGGIDRGVSLHALAAETAVVNSASVDNGAASTNGAVAHLNATVATEVTSVTIKIQESSDNGGADAWADIMTFTAVTGTTSERLTIAAGTTVERYVRCIISAFTGTAGKSLTYAVGFARR